MKINFPTGKVYAFFNGKLRCCEIKSIEVDGRGNVVSTVVESASKTFTLLQELKFYVDKSEYEAGNNIERPHIAFREFMKEWIDGVCHVVGFVMRENEPVYIKASVRRIVVEYDGSFRYKIVFDDESLCASSIYNTRELCLANNEYDVVEEDGSINHVVGVIKKTQLTPEQRALAMEVVEKLNQLHAMGVKTFANIYHDKMTFFNMQNVEDINVYCEEEDYVMIHKNNAEHFDCHICYDDDDCDYYVK